MKNIESVELFSSRLTSKILNENNAQSVLQYHLKNRKFFRHWIPVPPSDFYTLEFQRKILIEKNILYLQEKEARFYILKSNDHEKIIGEYAFTNIIKGAFWSCYLAYRMDEDEINKGYMCEAIHAGIKYIFETIKLHRIEANVMPRNKPSIRLLEKLNFEFEGLSKKYLKINGHWEDHARFVLLNDNV